MPRGIFFLTSASLALASAPALAAGPASHPTANPAAKLSLANAVPAHAPAQAEQTHKKRGNGLLIGGLVAIAVIVGVVAASGGGSPDSS
jgi:hypothetical protein